jgi:hypothetical protein
VSDYLSRLAARTLNKAVVIRPRLASRFEPTGEALVEPETEADSSVVESTAWDSTPPSPPPGRSASPLSEARHVQRRDLAAPDPALTMPTQRADPATAQSVERAPRPGPEAIQRQSPPLMAAPPSAVSTPVQPLGHPAERSMPVTRGPAPESLVQRKAVESSAGSAPRASQITGPRVLQTRADGSLATEPELRPRVAPAAREPGQPSPARPAREPVPRRERDPSSQSDPRPTAVLAPDEAGLVESDETSATPPQNVPSQGRRSVFVPNVQRAAGDQDIPTLERSQASVGAAVRDVAMSEGKATGRGRGTALEPGFSPPEAEPPVPSRRSRPAVPPLSGSSPVRSTPLAVTARPHVLPSGVPAAPTSAGQVAASEAITTIQVTIGRIEVRAAPPPAPTPSKKRARPAGKSLDEYLQQRANGGHR